MVPDCHTKLKSKHFPRGRACFSPELVEGSIARVPAGAAGAGRRLEDLDVCFGALCQLADDEREATRAIKPHVIATAQGGGAD